LCQFGLRFFVRRHNNRRVRWPESLRWCESARWIHAQLDQYSALTRDNNERITSAKANGIRLRPKELADLMFELVKIRGVEIYEQVKSARLATPQLDEWERKVTEQARLPPVRA
jgi:hypothetical protein